VIDGRDISPLLFGQSKQSPREAHYYFAGYNLQAVRQGPWKLAITQQKDISDKGPRLYNLDQDIGEQTNLADKHPDIVARLQALAAKMDAEITANRRPAGETPNPQTLYPSEGGKPSGKPKKAKTKRVALDALRPGDVLHSESAPQVAGKPFTISCVVETSQRDAVVVAHGGASVGYALYLKAGRPVFAIRTGGSVSEITAPDAMTGPVRITAALAADGTMTLAVNDHIVATGKAPGLLSRQPQEDFCVGHDNQKPVTHYSAHQPFVGSITQLKIATPSK
jgi:arylsulfatase A